MTKDITGHYTNFFTAWDSKALGPKPTASELDAIHKLGARPGKQALANAMSLREKGVTGAQIVMATGAPQLNKMRGFVQDGLLKREAMPADAKGHTVYKMTLTAKGTAKIKGASVTEKPKAVKKPKAKKPAPAPQPELKEVLEQVIAN